MPEGPEIKTLVFQLNKFCKGKKITDLNVHNNDYIIKHSSFLNHQERIENFKNDIRDKNYILDEVICKGKYFWFLFTIDDKKDDDKKALVCHLGMTGWWSNSLSKHTHLSLEFSKDKIYFGDVRCFGSLNLCEIDELKKFISKLGLDILSEEFTEDNFLTVYKKWASKTRSKKCIAEILLDQKLFCGIGNYLRADILYLSKINPLTVAKNIREENLKGLFLAIKEISNKSYIENGNTIRDYRDLSGECGNYNPLVYGKKNCPIGKKIELLTINKRTVYWCPEIQNA